MHGKGSRTRPLEPISKLHQVLLSLFIAREQNEAEIFDELHKQSGLEKLTLEDPANSDLSLNRKRKRFTRAATETAVVRQVLETRPRCPICHARLAPAFCSKDHRERKADGGTGSLKNLEFTHPYCQSGHKEKTVYEAKRI